jgi:hypothetical protein
VTKDLAGIANVYLMASSTSVGDPRLPQQIAEVAALQGVSFAVVHFNNGMHNWGYTESQFESGFSFFLAAVSALPGRPKLIWATITPVKPEATTGASNPRIDARNEIAKVFTEREKILVDDQHALMTTHLDLFTRTQFTSTKLGLILWAIRLPRQLGRPYNHNPIEWPMGEPSPGWKPRADALLL